jgi:diguanylate cyclase (GGDEF)-like protein
MKDQIRGIDCISRWGGEEFLIMLIETDLDDGQKVAERIRKNEAGEKPDFCCVKEEKGAGHDQQV